MIYCIPETRSNYCVTETLLRITKRVKRKFCKKGYQFSGTRFHLVTTQMLFLRLMVTFLAEVHCEEVLATFEAPPAPPEHWKFQAGALRGCALGKALGGTFPCSVSLLVVEMYCASCASCASDSETRVDTKLFYL